MFTFEELKRRKIVQWGLAYLAGAWVVLQLVDVVGDQFGWPGAVGRAITVLLAFGLLIALVLAWYHGEKGRQRASGVELLMLTGILLIAGAAIAFVRQEPAPEEPGAGTGTSTTSALNAPLIPVTERSIAVLPLDNLSPAGEHAYFAGAMTEQITSALSKVPELRVTSRNSASKFPESGMTVREFARELGVAHVLEGSVQRVGDDVRITVQLIDARTDEHLWTETYERELRDVLRVQVEIAGAVADRLAASFTERETQRILAGATDDPVAYDLFLRVQPLGETGPDEVNEAIGLLRQAIRRDPYFWVAWVELSFRFVAKARFAGPEWADSSRVALDRAIELVDDASFDALLRAFRAVLWGTDPHEAIDPLREAVASSPNNYLLVRNLASLLRFTGDLPEVARWNRRAAALNPLSPGPWILLATVYDVVGLYGPAERAIRQAIRLDPDDFWPWFQLVLLQTNRGRYPEALAAADSLELRQSEFARLARSSVHLWRGDPDAAYAASEGLDRSRLMKGPLGALIMPYFAHVSFLRGDSIGGRRTLARAEALIGTDPDPEGDNYVALQIAALRGDVAAAVDALRTYVREGGRDANLIAQDPTLSRVREDSAFQAGLAELERRVNRMRRQIERDLLSEP